MEKQLHFTLNAETENSGDRNLARKHSRKNGSGVGLGWSVPPRTLGWRRGPQVPGGREKGHFVTLLARLL